jgi:hypothetical protein
MSEEKQPESHSANVIRTLVALTVFAAFLAAIGYSFWPDIAQMFLRVRDQTQSGDAHELESQYFMVKNSSDASESQVRGTLKMLDYQYETISNFLKKTSEVRITVNIQNGEGFSNLEGDDLTIYYNQGVFNLDTVPFLLVFILEGTEFMTDTRFAISAGYATYVQEEVSEGPSLFGQSSDGWVVLFREKNAFIPLADIIEMNVAEPPQGGTDIDEQNQFAIMLQSIIEAGSLMRWIVDTNDIDTAREILAGADVESTLGMSLDEIESHWLKAIDDKKITSMSCPSAIPGSSYFAVLCRRLQSSDETSP